jgi:hypothetical protein
MRILPNPVVVMELKLLMILGINIILYHRRSRKEEMNLYDLINSKEIRYPDSIPLNSCLWNIGFLLKIRNGGVVPATERILSIIIIIYLEDMVMPGMNSTFVPRFFNDI